MPLKYLVLFLFSFHILSYSQNAQILLEEGKILLFKNKKVKAINKIEDALEAAEKERNVDLQMRCHLQLAELKDNVINFKEALQHYRDFADLYSAKSEKTNKDLKDSVEVLEGEVEEGEENLIAKEVEIDSLTNEQLQSALEIRDLEIENQKNQLEAKASENRKNSLIFLVIIFGIIVAFAFRAYLKKRKITVMLRQKNYLIAKAKEKSDDLLLNILPESVAEELKEYGRTKSAYHEDATVMFTDFKGFTRFTEKHSPTELVTVLDFYFSAFDKIIEKYEIEKIKTIGDAYLCASGIPIAEPNHANNMVAAAIELIAFIAKTKVEKMEANSPYLEVRIGLHTGPLVAGVVGSKKFAYDIWGDTVNIAARMEQSGESGQINVSETIYQLLKITHQFEYRGEIEAKNKGKMKMYFLKV